MKYNIILSCFTALLCAAPGCGEVVSGDETDAGADANSDPCETNVCECETAGDCGDHEFCDLSGPGRECACAVGYDDAPGGCTWGVVPEDPSFENAQLWTVRGGAGVSPLSSGDIAPGEAFFNVEAVCAMGNISQEVMMPEYEMAEPLVATVNYQSLGGGGFPGESTGAALGVGGTWKTFYESPSWTTQRVCLGASGYGGPVTIEVAPERQPYDCGFGGSSMLAIDHVQIVPAEPDECPNLGTVRNSDFEDMGGWEGYSSTNADAAIAPGAGDSGSNAYHLSTTQICNSASVTGKASLPSQEMVPSPAIEFWWNATNGKDLDVSLDATTIATLTGNGPNPSTARVCIPPSLQGSVASLRFSLPFSSGGCANPDVRDAYIDNIRFVSDPVCGTDPYVIDGGFESGLSPAVESPWSLVASASGHATLTSNPAQAHTGNGALELMVRQECSSSSASATVVVPAPDGANGPALKFWYNAANQPETVFRSSPGTGELPETGEWTQATVCLNPNLVGRPQRVTLTQTTNGGTCANTFWPEDVHVDDVELTTDPSCPTE